MRASGPLNCSTVLSISEKRQTTDRQCMCCRALLLRTCFQQCTGDGWQNLARKVNHTKILRCGGCYRTIHVPLGRLITRTPRVGSISIATRGISLGLNREMLSELQKRETNLEI